MPDDEAQDEEEKASEPKRKRWSRHDPITVKKVGAWVIGAAAVVGALAGLGSQVGGWLKVGLGITDLERRVGHLESKVEALEGRLRAHDEAPDANARLTEALPRVAGELRDARKERRILMHSTTRLATIHEFGLDQRRARAAASEVNRAMRSEEESIGSDSPTRMNDPLVALEGL